MSTASPAPASPLAPRLEVVRGVPDIEHSFAWGDASDEAWRDAAGAVFAYCRSRDGRHWIELPGLATFYFGGDGRVAAIPRPGVAAQSVVHAYTHSALPLVLQALGKEVLHASAVVIDRGVVALCGHSGSGKSTIAYGLYRRRHQIWADDAVLLEVSGPTITTMPLPFDVSLRPAAAALFGLGACAARVPGRHDSGADEEGPAAPLAAICVLDRGNGASGGAACRPLPAAQAYPALLAHAFCFSLEHRARKRLMLERYLSLVARVPVFALAYPDGLDGLPSVLDTVERALGCAS
jgi:hypothetical protein